MPVPLIVVLLGVAVLGWAYVQQRRHTAMAATPTRTCAEIAEYERPVTCEVKGTAAPGPRGPVTAPFSGRPCVWHRTKVTVRYEHHEERDGKTVTTTRERTVHDETYGAPFSVRDATGEITVVHEGRSVDHVARSLSHYEPAGTEVNLFGLHLRVNFSNVKGHRYEEWIIPDGQPMYVLGAAAAEDGRLVMRDPATGPFLISTRSEEALSAALRARFLTGYVLGGAVIAGGLIWLAVKLIHG
ncbi:E3 ubiquitin ligase family protein [Actinoallomurus rhizosphaericola]|uniref:E3 ubiquitin ligase family protein n=1 Tax=Actinoallomurus rhizosphaericola TaxID=2952536 RepID=UPI0020938831|nr:E3 ubiquitin ligase family protein [Actinoallomurus rhizosphaericola]MCO5996105.1 E3 ubiquitin ligase family protein [Actinoallomurus rhizosphaericola]